MVKRIAKDFFKEDGVKTNLYILTIARFVV
jgi:hypothetical protein